MQLKTNSLSRFSGTLGLAGALLAGSCLCACAQIPDSGKAPIVGTWRVTVTLQDCQTHAPVADPFHALLTFGVGGTFGGSAANPAFLPGQRSADFGVWSRKSGNTYTAHDEALIPFGGGPFSAGTQILLHNITLSPDGNSFTDAATTQFLDTNGNQVLPPPGCASATAQRVVQ